MLPGQVSAPEPATVALPAGERATNRGTGSDGEVQARRDGAVGVLIFLRGELDRR